LIGVGSRKGAGFFCEVLYAFHGLELAVREGSILNANCADNIYIPINCINYEKHLPNRFDAVAYAG
jgi:hypothetical protein